MIINAHFLPTITYPRYQKKIQNNSEYEHIDNFHP